MKRTYSEKKAYTEKKACSVGRSFHMPDKALLMKNIRKRIGGFLLNVDFSINEGELVSIIGPSGCGKTTVINLISGLLPPDSGTVSIGGVDVTELPPEKRSAAVVFQDYALFPHMNVQRNIAFPMKLRKMPRQAIMQQVESLLEQVKLGSFGKRPVDGLSGGEKQRVALARALAANPDILLLDEPLSALDAKLRNQLRGEILSIQQKLGQTTIYVTHDQSEALAISSRIIVMNNGQIEQTGTPQEIYDNPQTRFTADFMGEGNALPMNLAASAFKASSVDPKAPEAVFGTDIDDNSSSNTESIAQSIGDMDAISGISAIEEAAGIGGIGGIGDIGSVNVISGISGLDISAGSMLEPSAPATQRTVFFRPENVSIVDISSGLGRLFNRLEFSSCQVISAEYQGERWSIEFRFGSSTIKAYSKRPPRTERLDLQVKADDIMIFDQDARIK